MKLQLIIASTNKGKIREILEVGTHYDLPLSSFVIKSLQDFPELGPLKESQKTFAQNALLKARQVHARLGGFVLADDSGLECDDLDGEPGIFSARYAGPHATDQQNNQKLIKALQQMNNPTCKARYVCALALIDPDKNERLIQETCEGTIIFCPRGQLGFGYDPYFYLPEQKVTMAEISLEEKNKISHRGKALKKLCEILKHV